MTTVRLNSADPVSFDTDALIVGFRSGSEAPRPVTSADALDAAFGGKLAASLTAAGFSGRPGEIAKIPTFGAITAPLLVAVGLGDDASGPVEEVTERAMEAIRPFTG
ncbi:M17 family peptidase N-terminal domain-containing protein [Nonomuraea sp. NPDC005501]|uniref:M17 family peptidase N-terminal domain-containing protein n=1 Tax=Nonomuraea sp. NPDC005501 TaxID=3156884 RepID=UPI0033B97A12